MLDIPRRLLRESPASKTEVAAAAAALPFGLPSDLQEFYLVTNGAEGFVGDGYFRAYPVTELRRLNDLFRVQDFLPALTLFGSTAGGEAFAFTTGSAAVRYLRLPFIPFVLDYACELGGSLSTLFASIAGAQSPHSGAAGNPRIVGREIHETKPVIFGGDPVSPDNKVVLPTTEYAPLVVWWNQLYRDTISRG